mgnify:CR=1 FL=1
MKGSLQVNGDSKVRLVSLPEAVALDRALRAAKRVAAIGFGREEYAHLHGTDALGVSPSMTDEEYDGPIKRKFGAF